MPPNKHRKMTINVLSVGEAETQAKKDLSAHLAIPENTIKVLETEEATWPDASMEMPEPGHMYAQTLTEGYKVLLETEGKKFEYHFGNGTIKMRPAPAKQ
jgi:hypothetical protein